MVEEGEQILRCAQDDRESEGLRRTGQDEELRMMTAGIRYGFLLISVR
jgi:hypothetical protein